MFKNAIVRLPGKSIINSIPASFKEKPAHDMALAEHMAYIDALTNCGVKVTVLKADERYPDSTFVEDLAIVTDKCAVITRPGLRSRRGEELLIRDVLEGFFSNIEYIRHPGTLEGGDVLRVNDHFYIGLSERTNIEGALQLIDILNKYGYSASVIKVHKLLHLKAGISYIHDNNLIVWGELIEHPTFKRFNNFILDDDESYAAGCIWVNGYVLVPKGYQRIRDLIIKAGYKIIEIDVSEYRKIDGGLSSLSLRF